MDVPTEEALPLVPQLDLEPAVPGPEELKSGFTLPPLLPVLALGAGVVLAGWATVVCTVC